MVGIEGLKNTIDFLNRINTENSSIAFNPEGGYVAIKKRTCVRNLLGWLFHIITFTYVSRNAELDRVSQTIIETTERIFRDYQNIQDNERSAVIKALRNLRVIVDNNGGSQKKKIDNLVQTILLGYSPQKVSKIVEENTKLRKEALFYRIEKSITQCINHNTSFEKLSEEIKTSLVDLGYFKTVVRLSVERDPNRESMPGCGYSILKFTINFEGSPSVIVEQPYSSDSTVYNRKELSGPIIFKSI